MMPASTCAVDSVTVWLSSYATPLPPPSSCLPLRRECPGTGAQLQVSAGLLLLRMQVVNPCHICKNLHVRAPCRASTSSGKPCLKGICSRCALSRSLLGRLTAHSASCLVLCALMSCQSYGPHSHWPLPQLCRQVVRLHLCWLASAAGEGLLCRRVPELPQHLQLQGEHLHAIWSALMASAASVTPPPPRPHSGCWRRTTSGRRPATRRRASAPHSWPSTASMCCTAAVAGPWSSWPSKSRRCDSAQPVCAPCSCQLPRNEGVCLEPCARSG